MKISLIVPVYNAMRHLEECLNSVVAQTYLDYECICVDDGAIDGSGVYLDQFVAQHPKFKVIHKKNGGIASARNAGIEVAQGDWIMLMDDDDYIRPNLFENVVRASDWGERKGAFDVIRFGFDGFETTSDLSGDRWRGDPVCQESDFTFDEMSTCLGKRYFSGCMWRYAYRRSTLGAIRFEDYLPGEDMIYQMATFSKSRGCVNFDAFGYCYRIWGGSTIHQNINLRRFVDGRRYPIRMIELLAKSGKRIHPWIYHYLGVKLTETISDVSRLPASDRPRAWSVWYENMRKARQYDVFGRWQTFVMRVCTILPFKCIAFTLCIVPYRLKSMGLNRALLMRVFKGC